MTTKRQKQVGKLYKYMERFLAESVDQPEISAALIQYELSEQWDNSSYWDDIDDRYKNQES